MNPEIISNAYKEEENNTLFFDSKFETGNLDLAIKISAYEYDLCIEKIKKNLYNKNNKFYVENNFFTKKKIKNFLIRYEK